jgi:dTDP-4-amino-4,6-dideoxygalactose transaminase
MVTKATRAICAVHLYGQPADVGALQRIARAHGLKLIEDCAQAHGAEYAERRVGAIGDVGCFSCYPTKNLGGLGDAGMLVTNDDDVARRARLVREYGWAERYVSRIAGFNSRLDELQAAVLRVKLPSLDADNQSRRALAAQYDAALAALPLILPHRRADSKHVFHLYVVRCQDRDRVLEHLRASGVGALIHYPVPIHHQPAYAKRIRGGERLPQTERAAVEVLSLPIYPELSPSEVDQVVSALRSFAWS